VGQQGSEWPRTKDSRTARREESVSLHAIVMTEDTSQCPEARDWLILICVCINLFCKFTLRMNVKFEY
jgi:hypothetical protein